MFTSVAGQQPVLSGVTAGQHEEHRVDTAHEPLNDATAESSGVPVEPPDHGFSGQDQGHTLRERKYVLVPISNHASSPYGC
jgi:hypothetical protein